MAPGAGKLRTTWKMNLKGIYREIVRRSRGAPGGPPKCHFTASGALSSALERQHDWAVIRQTDYSLVRVVWSLEFHHSVR